MARKFISNNTKLEHQKQYNKFLSLDPQRKKKKNLHHHYQNVEEEEEEEEEEDEEKGKNQQPHFHIHSQEQVFHFQQPHELFSHHHNLLYQDLDIQQEAQPKKRSYFPPPAPPPPSSSSSCQKQKVGTSSRFGPRNCGGGGGEIVEVQGGHIIRSIGRKDRHSKVCTAKGPRDRRVRLAAHTAIQFYDVQDRLGYDRPSKAVDWLIKKAKASIDELAELPPWKPTIGPTTTNNNSFDQEKNVGIHCEEEDAQLVDDDNNDNVAGPSSKRAMIMLDNGSDTRVMHRNNSASSSGENANANGSFLPPSLDSDAISDTIKSFFPMGGGSNEGNSSAMQFHTFQEHNLLSRTNRQSQDLRLSLQSFQDPILLHHQNQQSQHHNHHTEQAQAQAHFQASNFFTGSTPLIGFDASGWSLEHHHQQPMELGRMQRLAAARAGGDNSTGIALDGGEVTGAGGYLFNSPPSPPLLQQLFVQNQFLSQRGPLQSSYSPSIRAWIDPSAIAIATADPIHHHHHQHHQAHMLPMYSASVSGIGFASEVGGFSGFRIPARIQGEIEEHDGISDKPSSASSDSRH